MLLRHADRGSGGPPGRLDLAAIAAALPGSGSDDVPRRLLEGYRYVDELLAGRVDIFAWGESRHILELNHRVLCGVSPERRQQHADHLAETERRFYDDPAGGMASLHEWHERNRGRGGRPLAAGAFVQAVSTPQLFIEGNRRTALMIASYLLARSGLPPMVVPQPALPRFQALSERVLAIDRDGLAGGIALTLAARRVGDFIAETADPRYLRAEASATS
jgi:hypothetical protein